MAHRNTIFRQLLQLVDRHVFNRVERERFKSERQFRCLNRWQQFTAMMFAQLAGLSSLRDIAQQFEGHDLDFTVATNRLSIDDFCGSRATLKAALQAVQKRLATVLEKLFATGTGSSASPATAVVSGSISYTEVFSAMGW